MITHHASLAFALPHAWEWAILAIMGVVCLLGFVAAVAISIVVASGSHPRTRGEDPDAGQTDPHDHR